MSATATGKKVTTAHRTLTDTSAEIVEMLERNPDVTKIALGTISHTRGGRRDLKFHPITGGTKVAVRGDGAVHDLYVYTHNPQGVEQALRESFEK